MPACRCANSPRRAPAAGAPASIFAVREAAEAGSAYWWDRLSFLEGAMDAEEWARFGGAIGLADVTSPGRGGRARDMIVARHRGALPPAAATCLPPSRRDIGTAEATTVDDDE